MEPEELETLCDLATEFSRYAAAETLREGTCRCGADSGSDFADVDEGGVNTNLKELSSAVIRIAREQKGIAEDLAPRLFRNGRFVSTLILSPPGGKDHAAAGPGAVPFRRAGRLRPPSGLPDRRAG